MQTDHPSQLTHIVLQVDEAVLHVFSTEPIPAALLEEAKRPLTGVYLYDKHTPHTTPGQYHLHVYLKQNEIFAINWDGSAHDQSHQKVIPGRVFNALKAKFPNLILPPNRIIESIALDPSLLTPKQAARLGTDELVALRQIIVEEVQCAGAGSFPLLSRFGIYEGNRVPFVGWPLLLMCVEYRDNGDAVGEGHLIWTLANKRETQARGFAVKPTSFVVGFGSRLEFLSYEIVEWAKAEVQLRTDRQWAKDRGAWPYPNPVMNERSFEDLLRLWMLGRLTTEITQVRDATRIEELRANLTLITSLTPISWSFEDLGHNA